MRNSFNFTKFSVAHWFPGHMGKGMNQVLKKIQKVDCVVEVHDARIPLSGRNPLFDREAFRRKPHILVMNKVDLISETYKDKISGHYKNMNQTLLFSNCKKSSEHDIRYLIPAIREKINTVDRKTMDYSVMIIGIPNVGKSSLINALRAMHLKRTKATAVGATPGVTRSVLERIKVSIEVLKLAVF